MIGSEPVTVPPSPCWIRNSCLTLTCFQIPSLTSTREDHLHIPLISPRLRERVIKEVCAIFFHPLIVAAPWPSWCPSLRASTLSLPPYCCPSLQSLVWSESQTHPYLSFATQLLCLSVLCYPWGGISPPPLSISSHVLRTLVFICLWACHVPEPALISIPRNAVYLPRCCQEGRGGESEWDWEQEERESWLKESKSRETLSRGCRG